MKQKIQVSDDGELLLVKISDGYETRVVIARQWRKMENGALGLYCGGYLLDCVQPGYEMTGVLPERMRKSW